MRGQARERRDLLIKLLNLGRIPHIMQLANEKSKLAAERISFIEKELERFSSIDQTAIEGLQEEKVKLKEQEKTSKDKLTEQEKILAELEKLKQLFDEKSTFEKSLLELEGQNTSIEEKRKKIKFSKTSYTTPKTLG